MPTKWYAQRRVRDADEKNEHIFGWLTDNILFWSFQLILSVLYQIFRQIPSCDTLGAQWQWGLRHYNSALWSERGEMTGSQTTHWVINWSRVITNKSGRENITKPHNLASWSTVKHCWWLGNDSRKEIKYIATCKLLGKESSIYAKLSCNPWGKGDTFHDMWQVSQSVVIADNQ